MLKISRALQCRIHKNYSTGSPLSHSPDGCRTVKSRSSSSWAPVQRKRRRKRKTSRSAPVLSHVAPTKTNLQQKQKLKVGKARPKAENHTDTSFRSKAITLSQQLDINAPSQTAVFVHQVSLLSSRSDTSRKDALGYLTTYVASLNSGANLPVTTSSFLNSLCPLILDGSPGVRNNYSSCSRHFQGRTFETMSPRSCPICVLE